MSDALPPGAVLLDDPPDSAPQGHDSELPHGATLLPDEEEHRTLGGAFVEGAKNLPSSIAKNLGQMAEGVGSMVTHPIDTAKTLGKLAVSVTPLDNVLHMLTPAVTKLMGDEDGAKFKSMLDNLDAPKKALIDDYVKAYGGGQNILKTIATDPARVLTDIATIATGGEAALAKLPGIAGKVGKVAGMAKYVDPVQIAAKGVEKAAPYVGKTVAGMSNLATGSGAGAMQEAFKSGYLGGDMATDFRGAMRGKIPMDEVVSRAKQAVQDIEDAGVGEYLSNKSQWEKDASKLNFDKVDAERTKLMDSLTTKDGAHLKVSKADADKIGSLDEIIGEWKNDPRLHNPLGFDDLKQRIRAETNFLGASPQVKRAGTVLSKAVQDTIFDVVGKDSPYARSMEALGTAKGHVRDIEQAFSLGDKASAQTAMTKLQSLMRKNVNTQWGHREAMADKLNDLTGVNLRPLVAGQALSHWAPHGITRHLIGGGAPFALFAHPGAWPAVAGSMLASSPRLQGEIYHGLGRAARMAPRPPGAPARVFARDWGEIGGEPSEQQARGGRIGYADGGSVEDDSMPLPVLRAAVDDYGYISAVPKIRPVQPVMQQAPQAIPPEIAAPPRQQQQAPQPTSSVLDPFTKMLEGQFGEKKKDPMDELREILKRTGTLPTVPPGSLTNKGVGSDPGTGATTGDSEARALSGDTYEDKVGGFESGNRDTAVNANSGAAGRYQFAPSTAEGIRQQHPELGISDNWRTNADDQKKLMKVYTDTSREILRKQLGREPTGGELYMLHLMGQGKGPSMLGNLDQDITAATTAQERNWNPILGKHKTVRDLLKTFNTMYGG